MSRWAVVYLALTSRLFVLEAFAPVAPSHQLQAWASVAANRYEVVLDAKKKKRRRKRKPGSPLPPQPSDKHQGEEESVSKEDLSVMEDVANIQFEMDDAITRGIQDEEATSDDETPLVLPDIKEMLRKKELEAELARVQEEEQAKVPKIKRSDREAFTKLLEQQPYADADDSLFEKEEYGTVSALLGEGAKSFLGIPFGPLQVGHFIGALGIVLMAFVEYPGFPLTNLPTPLRGCLQGGLATVYAINIVLAVLATFKAGERGQSKLLWAAKTFSVGGLAYDQLTQLPTLEQVEEVKSRKGARALKKKR